MFKTTSVTRHTHTRRTWCSAGLRVDTRLSWAITSNIDGKLLSVAAATDDKWAPGSIICNNAENYFSVCWKISRSASSVYNTAISNVIPTIVIIINTLLVQWLQIKIKPVLHLHNQNCQNEFQCIWQDTTNIARSLGTARFQWQSVNL